MRGQADLRRLAAVALACAAGSLIAPLGAVRIVFAVPLALFLPGYALTAAAFGPRQPSWSRRLPLALGVSLACLALGGLLLNYTPGGIQGLPWTILLVVIVLLGCAVAARRRGTSGGTPGSVPRSRPSPATAILAAGSLAMAVAAVALAHRTPRAEHAFGYTQLWIAPPKPTDISARIGVTSQQQQTRAYRLVVEVEGRPTPVERSFELAPSQSHLVTIRSGRAASPVRVQASLYLRGHPTTLYRRVFTRLGGRVR
ncbi:MAG TPA: DUF1616 domain-containing protein [Chloroflexota bacterium]|nr:DUF1616 domain-containing protein [Chloroflexota bacterium]